MAGSLVVGIILTGLGAMCVIAGTAISAIEAMRPQKVGAFAISDAAKLGKVIAEILKQFGKLKPAGQLLFIGVVLLGAGIWLLAVRPF